MKAALGATGRLGAMGGFLSGILAEVVLPAVALAESMAALTTGGGRVLAFAAFFSLQRHKTL